MSPSALSLDEQRVPKKSAPKNAPSETKRKTTTTAKRNTTYEPSREPSSPSRASSDREDSPQPQRLPNRKRLHLSPGTIAPPEERHLTVRLPLFSERRNHLLRQLEPNRNSLVLKHLQRTLITSLRLLKPHQYLAAANLGFVPRSIPVPPSIFQLFVTSHPQMAHLQRTISSQPPPLKGLGSPHPETESYERSPDAPPFSPEQFLLHRSAISRVPRISRLRVGSLSAVSPEKNRLYRIRLGRDLRKLVPQCSTA